MILCEDLSKQFDSFWAVDGVSLNVQQGEVLALLGQNGAGKTTTVRMLTSVLRPTRGWARIAGHDVTAEPTEVRRRVGVLTEQHGLYGRMTASEYLDFFGSAYGLPQALRRERSVRLLEHFGLAEVAGRRSGDYSKGMRQKLALARALLHEPPVLLLDEPTSAMDPESARLVRDHIASLRSDNRAIIICTHNLTEAEALADKISIIYRGRVLLQGAPEDLKRQLLGLPVFEITFTGAWSLTDLPLPEGVEVLSQGPQGFRYRAMDVARANPLLLQAAAARGLQVLTLQEEVRSLEQVYLKAMSQAAGRTQ